MASNALAHHPAALASVVLLAITCATQRAAADDATARDISSPPAFAIVPRAGLLAAGSATADASVRGCVGATCRSYSTSLPQTERSGFAFGATALASVQGPWRLGLDAWVDPNWTLGSQRLGTQLTTTIVAERLVPLSSTVALTPRLDAGIVVLFPSHELDSARASCFGPFETFDEDGSSGGATCQSTSGPFGGTAYGGGAGLLVVDGRFRPRIDLSAQWYSIGLGRIHRQGSLGGFAPTGPQPPLFEDVATRLSGFRMWIVLGAEL